MNSELIARLRASIDNEFLTTNVANSDLQEAISALESMPTIETEWLDDLLNHYLEEERTYRGWGKVGRADHYKAMAERVRQALPAPPKVEQGEV